MICLYKQIGSVFHVGFRAETHIFKEFNKILYFLIKQLTLHLYKYVIYIVAREIAGRS